MLPEMDGTAIRGHSLKKTLAKKGVAFGTWAQIGSAEICDAQARSGLDFVIIDMEHGSFGIETATNMIRAVEAGGAAPVVRIADHSPVTVLKALDAGATGIIAPNIETAEQMQSVVDATRYPPAGTRGACPGVRANGHGIHDWASWTEWTRDNIFVMGTVETLKGLDNFPEIIGVDGLDAISIGQFDLSVRLGLGGRHRDPEVVRRQRELGNLARARNIDVFSAVFEPDPDLMSDSVRQNIAAGSRILALSGDRFLLAAGYTAIGAVARAQSNRPASPSSAG